MTAVLLIIIAVVLFGLIIFVHEFGHFFTAKLSGIRVNEFALGMGPKLFSFGKGETIYTLRLLPIGGYCAMEGEDEESEDDKAFSNKPVWKRMIVVVAGAVMNIIFGFLLMLFVVCQFDLLGTTQIAAFVEGSKLEAAGAQAYDYIYEIDGYRTYTEKDLSFALAMADPESVDFVLARDNKLLLLEDVKLDSYEGYNGRQSVVIDFHIFGIQKSFKGIMQKSFYDTYSLARTVVVSLKGIVTGEFGLNEISGPVGAAQAITQAASEGLKTSIMDAVINIVTMMALISVNLGIFNLLPFPALDGGRFVFLLIEGIVRKPIPRKYEAYVNAAGLVCLLALMAVITFKDIFYLFK